MKQQPQASSLADILASLTNHEGLREPTLRHNLGSGLRALCDIVAEDNSKDVFRKAFDKFEWAIEKLTGVDSFTAEEIQILARINYNIAPYSESRKKTAGERRKWLGDNENQTNWEDSSRAKPIFRVTTGRNKMDNHVVPELERMFLADWHARFPDKPFPLDQTITDGLVGDKQLYTDGDTKQSNGYISGSPKLSLTVTGIFRRLGKKKSIALIVILTLVLTGAIAMIWTRSRGISDNPVGNALRITLLGVSDIASGDSAVFASSQKASADRFVQRVDQAGLPNEGPHELLTDELVAGAYLLGGVKIFLNAEGLDANEVTIYNVRPVSVIRHDIVTATIIAVYPQGGGPAQMTFALDQANPIAREEDGNRKPGRPFFEVQELGLRKKEKQELQLSFHAKHAAYEFKVAIDYEVSGQKYTQIVDHNGRPFRVSAPICPSGMSKNNLHYGTVREFAPLRLATAAFSHPEPYCDSQ